ncbi:MAG: hypothetical protein ACYSTY_02485 [Planctomycetota bacterium]|jgi:hypothetical protein
MSEASIKGVAIQPIVELTHELLDSGRISRDQAESALGLPELRLLDEKLEPTLWYPIASAQRIEFFVAETMGWDVAEMMRDLGITAAKRTLHQSGTRNLIEGARKHDKRMGHIIVGLGSLIVNFGEWKFHGDVFGEFRLDATGMDPFPETTRYATEGFIEVLAHELTGHPAVATSERPSPSHIIFEGRIGV